MLHIFFFPQELLNFVCFMEIERHLHETVVQLFKMPFSFWIHSYLLGQASAQLLNYSKSHSQVQYSTKITS